jgi:putative transposase
LIAPAAGTADVLNKLPNNLHAKAKRALQKIWMAETKKDAVTASDTFAEPYNSCQHIDR